MTSFKSNEFYNSTNQLNNQSLNIQPPSYEQTIKPDSLDWEEKFHNVIALHEINQFYANKIKCLSKFKIVFVFDDSGSMKATLKKSPLNTYGLKATRWDELQYFAKIGIDIANLFNSNGTDVYFLNGNSVHNVSSFNNLAPYFQRAPSGYTPLSRVINSVLNNNNPMVLGDKKLLIVVVTDGEPTDDIGKSDIKGFKNVLKFRHPNIHTTIVSCTDDRITMSYLNNWDRFIPRLDVMDDFVSERKEVFRLKGSNFPFSFGDYVVKCIIGSIDMAFDQMDETISFRRSFKKRKDKCPVM
ncbi:unnamed protein product [Brachionus calyciflorus]|uniref:VWFA domain-containing protein n=1 Tax=Brachionus calyciflorus TaxID=104777 RepID=A0A813ZUW5_9BILA|nr:unnamed protein product [Brachionus calyciflorus]